MDSLGILKQIDPPILDAASQDFNLSKFCAIWSQEMKWEFTFHDLLCPRRLWEFTFHVH